MLLSLEMLHAILPNNLRILILMNDSLFMQSAGFGGRKGSRVNLFVYAPNYVGWAYCSIIDLMGGHVPLFYGIPFFNSLSPGHHFTECR